MLATHRVDDVRGEELCDLREDVGERVALAPELGGHHLEGDLRARVHRVRHEEAPRHRERRRHRRVF